MTERRHNRELRTMLESDPVKVAAALGEAASACDLVRIGEIQRSTATRESPEVVLLSDVADLTFKAINEPPQGQVSGVSAVLQQVAEVLERGNASEIATVTAALIADVISNGRMSVLHALLSELEAARSCEDLVRHSRVLELAAQVLDSADAKFRHLQSWLVVQQLLAENMGSLEALLVLQGVANKHPGAIGRLEAEEEGENWSWRLHVLQSHGLIRCNEAGEAVPTQLGIDAIGEIGSVEIRAPAAAVVMPSLAIDSACLTQNTQVGFAGVYSPIAPKSFEQEMKHDEQQQRNG